MIQANEFLDECKKMGLNLFTGTPCSYLKPFINYVIDDKDLDFVPMTNEGDAVAFASGAHLAGKKAVVMFQNSGLGNAVNPLTSLNAIFNIPVLGIVTLRGEPGGPHDEPQHALMGKITTSLLDEMEIPWKFFPTQKEDVVGLLEHAKDVMDATSRPFFFVMKKDSVMAHELKNLHPVIFPQTKDAYLSCEMAPTHEVTRTDALCKIRSLFGPKAALVATTGKTGRELYEIEDTENQIYMVGSMGCAVSFGLGINYVRKNEKTVVIDGDGALMMRMGNLTSAGLLQNENFIHILLDNGVHDSTGGQKSYSESVDFSALAQGCGYRNILKTNSLESLESFLKEHSEGPLFVHFKIKKGSPSDLGRPKVTPAEVAIRFKKFLKD